MVEIKESPTDLITVSVELFGSARLLCGSRVADVETPRATDTGQLAAALADRYPQLLGKVVREDRQGLLGSYTFNLNGVSFIGAGPLDLQPGDSVLLFSSQAGG